jgi:serine phosphatase RsbU (regulator of sigma subunit)
MVRYALYTATRIADAVTALNGLLVEHDLLSGFATAFLGVFDHAERTLTYVNCGQEPGLLWRAATGEMEELRPTGPVLGGFNGGSYTQAIVSLQPGDVLALFTDGLTEVGPSRKDLLEIEGVSRLLGECAADHDHGNDPQAVVDCLVAGVDVFGQGGVGDDIALLVGVVTGVAAPIIDVEGVEQGV